MGEESELKLIQNGPDFEQSSLCENAKGWLDLQPGFQA